MSAPFFLSRLFLKNFVTFTSETIEFKEGLNSIIGETGSGKSLVLEALYLILGGRGDKKIIRKDSDFALIEATFTSHNNLLNQFLELQGFPLDSEELTIKRIIYKNGQNKNFINDMNCSLGVLNSFTKKFIDIVGQFENQKLLSSSYQLQLVDHFSSHQSLLDIFRAKFNDYQETKSELTKVEEIIKNKDSRIEFLNYQINEISELNPSEEEEKQLISQKQKYLNFERILKNCNYINEIFDGTDQLSGILSLLGNISTTFKKNSDLFQDCQALALEIEEKIYLLKKSVNHISNFELSTEDYEIILDKLDKYQHLKRKHNGSISDVLVQLNELIKEKENLEKLEFQSHNLQEKLINIQNELSNLAENLHLSRISNAQILAKKLTETIRSLNMPGATFKIEIIKNDQINEMGISDCCFIAETNLGEGYFKIKEIASGGELSRILLAVRQILSNSDSISIFLFDEIDTGIGGETANLIGKALKNISSKGQVIAVTHLPQIAQFSDNLLIVQKETNTVGDSLRTESVVKNVLGKNIIKEAKSMISLN
jgi:DNA repair protein RecN (Recombination protein N)